MRPLSLELKGFTCFAEKQRVDFADMNLFAITGATGSGKSSLIDAMIWTLYGRVPRMGGRNTAALIAQGADQMWASYTFEQSGGSWRATRLLPRSGKPQAYLERLVDEAAGLLGGWEEVAAGTRAVNQAVEAQLGLHYDGFVQAVVLPQGRFADFLHSNPSDRQKLLQRLLRQDIYQRMRTSATERRRAIKPKVEGLQRRLSEDYEGADADALERGRGELAALEAQHRAGGQALAEQAAGLKILLADRDLWARWDALALERAELEARAPAIEAERGRWERGRRAEPFLHLLTDLERLEAERGEAALRLEDAAADAAAAVVVQTYLPDPTPHELERAELARQREAIRAVLPLLVPLKHWDAQRARLDGERLPLVRAVGVGALVPPADEDWRGRLEASRKDVTALAAKLLRRREVREDRERVEAAWAQRAERAAGAVPVQEAALAAARAALAAARQAQTRAAGAAPVLTLLADLDHLGGARDRAELRAIAAVEAAARSRAALDGLADLGPLEAALRALEIQRAAVEAALPLLPRLAELDAKRARLEASCPALIRRVGVGVVHPPADEDWRARLEGAREEARTLASETARRRELGGERDAAEVLRRRHAAREAAAEEEAAAARAAAEAAQRTVELATQMLEGARGALGALERAHSAAHLRQTLRPGGDCPVCLQPVRSPPAAAEDSPLDGAQRALAAARSEVEAAEAGSREAAQGVSEADQVLALARQNLEHTQGELTRLEGLLAGLEAAIAARVSAIGALLGEGLDPRVGAEALPAWLERALALQDLAISERDRDAATAEGDGLRAKIRAATAAEDLPAEIQRLQALERSRAQAIEELGAARAAAAARVEADERALLAAEGLRAERARSLAERSAQIDAELAAAGYPDRGAVDRETLEGAAGAAEVAEAGAVEAERRAVEADQALALARQDLEQTQGELTRLEGLLAELEAAIAARVAAIGALLGEGLDPRVGAEDLPAWLERALALQDLAICERDREAATAEGDGLRAKIRAATAAEDLPAEIQRLQALEQALTETIQRLQKKKAAAVEKVAVTERERQSAAALLAERERQLREREAQVAAELAAAGYVDRVSVASQALDAAALAALERELRDFDEQAAAAADQGSALEGALGGRTRVMPETAAAAERQVEGARADLEARRREITRREWDLEVLERRVGRAATLLTELEALRAELGIYSDLEKALGPRRFPRVELDASFQRLVQGASLRLRDLSGGRYEMSYREGEFYVVDQDNAGEERRANTLSGGETFFAALALALELSEQVQHTHGAIRLDSLFVDEGFSSLDEESLDAAISVIEKLSEGQRVIGVITHVRAMSDRLPARVLLERRPGGSRLSVERT